MILTIHHVGKKVALTLKNESYIGHVEERFISKWPEVKTEIVINIPGRFPRASKEFIDMGFTISLIKE